MFLLGIAGQLQAQFFNDEVKHLYGQAIANNDTLQLYRIQQEQAAVDRQSMAFAYLPKVSFTGTYTRLNDDITFPDNLQQLLMGTQSLLIKEQLGLGFNTPLPTGIPLQSVDAIQRKDILKTTLNGQWLLFSGFKVNNAMKAYQHQSAAYHALTEKQATRLWLDVAEVYDKMALVQRSTAILETSERLLSEQGRFVEAAIRNGLATPLERKRIELAQQKLTLKKMENRNNQAVLAHKMHQLTGVPESELTTLRPVLVPVAYDFAVETNTRPELNALDESIAATRYQEKAAWADYVPKVAAFGQYELRERDLSLLDPQWYVGIRLQWNLFDGFAARNNAKKASLQRQAYTVQRRAAEDKINLGQAKLQEDYLLARQQLQVNAASVQLTEDTYDFVGKQYRNGLVGLTDVLDALNDLEKARFEQEQSVYNVRRVALQAADLQGTLLNNL